MLVDRRTIAAITTPVGEGGISVIQVSGPDSVEIVNKVFRGKGVKDLSQAEDGKLYYGNIEAGGVPIDEAIVNVSRKNGSFTGHDLVGVNCHGGILSTRRALGCIKAVGAVEVDWQELLTQSLENNKIDAVQREALLEIPGAKTTLALKVFLDQYRGALSEELLRCGIRDAGCGVAKEDRVNPAISERQSAIARLLDTAEFGIALSAPRKITIAGSPNAGKSTLVNALLGKERTIVHHDPGTTRDAVSDIISVNGMPFELTDTAGVRDTDNVVEGLAIRETLRRLAGADIAVIVFDNSRPLNDDEVKLIKSLETIKDKPLARIIPVVNKIDLSPVLNINELQAHFSEPVCSVSALNFDGISEFSYRFIEKFADYINYAPGRPIVFTERQRGLLAGAADLDTNYHGGRPLENRGDSFSKSNKSNHIASNSPL